MYITYSCCTQGEKDQLVGAIADCIEKMVFCYQNCSDLLWEKIVLVIEKTFEGQKFEIFLRSLEQFTQTVKGLNNFW